MHKKKLNFNLDTKFRRTHQNVLFLAETKISRRKYFIDIKTEEALCRVPLLKPRAIINWKLKIPEYRSLLQRAYRYKNSYKNSYKLLSLRGDAITKNIWIHKYNRKTACY